MLSLAPFPPISSPGIGLGYTLGSRREGYKEAVFIQGPGKLPRKTQGDKALPSNRFFNLIIPNSGGLLCDGRDLVFSSRGLPSLMGGTLSVSPEALSPMRET